jgi:hypothetical protein
MQSVHQIASEILDREGGFVNDPDDPGGATNFGVTIHTMRRLGLDLTGLPRDRQFLFRGARDVLLPQPACPRR